MKLNLIHKIIQAIAITQTIKNYWWINLIFLTTLISSFIAVFYPPVLAESNQISWSYKGATNPGQWGKISPEFALCNLGKNQSPININNIQKITSINLLEFKYQPTSLLTINNGNTIQVNYKPGSKIKIKSEEYELLQFHFHTPSEHTINGKQSAMEMHLVHRNLKGELAVVAIIMEEGAANTIINEIILNSISKNDFASINAADLLPKNKAYFSYTGSLTTPPCSENVKWNVLAEPIQVSKDQIAYFQRSYQFNARPVQPINGRKIESHRA
jgi:carbonic anhydrase